MTDTFMKKVVILVFIMILSLLTLQCKTENKKEEVYKKEIPYEFKEGTLKYYPDNDKAIESGVLAKEICVRMRKTNVLFKATNISFHENGEIKGGYLGKDVELLIGKDKKIKFRAGDYIEFYQTYFGYEGGEVSLGYLTEDTKFMVGKESITFKGSGKISFHLSGDIEGGCLIENKIYTVGKKQIEFKAGTYVRFHENGNLHWGTLPEDVEFTLGNKKIKFMAGSEMQFYETGEVWSGILAEDREILTDGENVMWKKGEHIYFTESGDAFWIDY